VNIVIAIDGPAAAGKSTTARMVAERLGYLHVDTGAMYRAVTLKVLRRGIDIHNIEEVEKLAEQTEIRLERDTGRRFSKAHRSSSGILRVLLDGKDVTEKIRKPEVDRAVSAVSSYKKVREVMVREQRRMGKEGGIVLEGRDIGTVVFPDAQLKIYMVANVEERARRRQKELAAQGIETGVEDLVNEIIARDEKDSNRILSPLRKADDAVILDTSTMSIEQQVDFIVHKAKEILGK
jgi:cytidylate kinase